MTLSTRLSPAAGLRRHSEIFLALGLCLLAHCEFAFAETLPRWKLTPGETLVYRFTQNSQTTTAGAGKPLRVAIDTAMTVTWKVETVDAQGVASITQTIDRFSVTMTTDKLDPITFDSASKASAIGPAREIAESVGQLIGGTCRIQMTNRGEILTVDPSAPLKRALGSPAGPATGAAVSILTPEGMSRMLKQAAMILPEKPLVEGATWEVIQETPVPFGTILQNSQFTYAGVTDQEGTKLDKIDVATTFRRGPGDKSSPTIKEGSQSGWLWFDSAAGRFAGSELTQNLVTERPYREMTMRVQSTSKLTMKLVR